MFNNRDVYRNLAVRKGLVSFKVTVQETDLLIHATDNFTSEATQIVQKYRRFIESHIDSFPDFATTLTPWKNRFPAHRIIREMCDAGEKAHVGPMASIAGAIAEYTGKELSHLSNEIIVENGGDIYLNIKGDLTMGIYAGASPLSMKLGLEFNNINKPFSVCTSSGTVGHSLSLGRSDAVCVIADSALLADAAATSIGNHVKSDIDLNTAINFGQTINGVKGIVVIVKDKIGMWGEINIVKLKNS